MNDGIAFSAPTGSELDSPAWKCLLVEPPDPRQLVIEATDRGFGDGPRVMSPTE
jgi:hypothetical protein